MDDNEELEQYEEIEDENEKQFFITHAESWLDDYWANDRH